MTFVLTNKWVLLVAVIGCTVIILAPTTTDTVKNVAMGALGGLVGGHLNGAQHAQNNSPPPQ